jgi:hypothetical protein
MKRIVFFVAVFVTLMVTLASTRVWSAVPDAAPTFITLVDSTGKTESTHMIGSFLKLHAEPVFPEGSESSQVSIFWEIKTIPAEVNAVFFVDAPENSASYERTLYLSDPVDVAEITASILQDGIPHPTRKATYTVHVFNPVSGITLTDDNGKTDSICVAPNGKWKIYAKPVFADVSFTPKLNWNVVSKNVDLEEEDNFTGIINVDLEEEDNFTGIITVKGYDTANVIVTVCKLDGTPDSSLSATYRVHAPRPISFTLKDDNGKTNATYEVGNDIKLHAKPVYEAGIDVVPQVAWTIDCPEKASFKDNNSGSLDRTLSIADTGTLQITVAVLKPDNIADPARRDTYTLQVPIPEPLSLTLTDNGGKTESTCEVGAPFSLRVKPDFANETQKGLFEQGKVPLQIVWLINGLPAEESSILSLTNSSSDDVNNDKKSVNENEYEYFVSIKMPADAAQITAAVRRSDGTADPVRRAVYTLHIPVPQPKSITLIDSEDNTSSGRVVGDEFVLTATHVFANETQKALQIFPPVVWSIKTDPPVGYTAVTFTDNNPSALVRKISVIAPVVGSVKVSVVAVLPDGTNRSATYTLQIPEPIKSVDLSALNESGPWKKGDTLHLKAEYELESGVDASIIPQFVWWIEMKPPTAPSVVSLINPNTGTDGSLVVEGYGTAEVVVAAMQPDGTPHSSLRKSYIVQTVSEPAPIGIKITDLSGKTDSTGIVGNLLQLHAEPVFEGNILLSDLQTIPPVVWQIVSVSGKESSAASFVDNHSLALDRTLSIDEPVDTVQIIAAIQAGGSVCRDTYLLYVPVPEPVSIILTDFDGNTSSTHVLGEQIDVRAVPIFANVIQNNLKIVPKVVWKIEDIPSEELPVVSFTVDDEEDEENARALVRTLFVVGHGTAHITVSLLQPDDVPDPILRATYTVHVPGDPVPTPTPAPEKPYTPPVSLFPTVQDTEQPVIAYKDATLHLRYLAGYTARLITLTGQVVVAFTIPTDDYRFPLFLSPAACIFLATDGVTQHTFKLLVD